MSKNTYLYEELDNIGTSLYNLGNLVDVLAFAICQENEKPSYEVLAGSLYFISSSLEQIGSRVDDMSLEGGK